MTLREWHTKAKADPTLRRSLSKLRNQLLKINLPDTFPSELVFKEYTGPNVDKSMEKFTWSMPDLDSIRKYVTFIFSNNRVFKFYFLGF
jgi:hypothetical protein